MVKQTVNFSLRGMLLYIKHPKKKWLVHIVTYFSYMTKDIDSG